MCSSYYNNYTHVHVYNIFCIVYTLLFLFQINAVNLNYSDNGLFGMYAVAHGKNIRQVWNE